MAAAHHNADPAELAKFGALAHRWWDPQGEFRPLHELNPLRLGWIDGLAPLAGMRVLELTQIMSGPTCGLMLADLGAEVIKVEPLEGDNTRRLEAAGAGFFPVFNRNKKSLAVDLKQAEGRDIVHRLIDRSDALTENFRPGALDKLGFGYAALSDRNPRLIYCSLKGFLRGPYEHRPALDEVTQMMGGLAYMTGRPGDPLRAGSSVNDIMGGMFGAIAILVVERAKLTFPEDDKEVASSATAI